jgi:hypothetical protein
MVAGKLPFAGGTVTEVLAQRMTRTPPPLDRERPGTPPWLVRLVDRLLRPQPAHRMQQARDVVRAIDTRSVPYAMPRLGARRIAAVVALCALVAVAIGGGWWWGAATQGGNARDRRVAAAGSRAGVAAGARRRRARRPCPRLRSRTCATPWRPRRDWPSSTGNAPDRRVRQLDAVRAGTFDVPTLQRNTAARRACSRTSGARRQAGKCRRSCMRSMPPPCVRGPAARTPRRPCARWLATPAFAQALHMASAPMLLLPASDAALDAHGAGLAAMRDGHLADALTHLQAATRAAPDDASAWLAQADAALAIGEQDLAYDATERGLRATQGSSGAVQCSPACATHRGARAARWRRAGRRRAVARLARGPARDDTEAELGLARALGAGGDFNAAVNGLQASRRPGSPTIRGPGSNSASSRSCAGRRGARWTRTWCAPWCCSSVAAICMARPKR